MNRKSVVGCWLLAVGLVLPMVGGAYPSGGVQVEQVLSGSKSRVPSSAAVSDALGSESNRIDSLAGNIAKSYVVVYSSDTVIATFPYQGVNEDGYFVFYEEEEDDAVYYDGAWKYTDSLGPYWYVAANSSGRLPSYGPYEGQGPVAGNTVYVEFFPGQFSSITTDLTDVTLTGTLTLTNTTSTAWSVGDWTNTVPAVGTNGVYVELVYRPNGETNIYYSLYQ